MSLFRLQIFCGAAGHCGDCQRTGQRSLIGGAEAERRRRKMEQSRGQEGEDTAAVWVKGA